MSGFPKRIKMYVHGSKEAAWEAAERAGLSGEGLSRAKWMLHEVTCEVDLYEDGTADLVSASDGVTTLCRQEAP